jgi:polysaccharide export outer membrane protein
VKSNLAVAVLLLAGCMAGTPARAETAVEDISLIESTSYLIQPGDVLQIAVWREPDLQLEVMVRPDGGISAPLLGEVVAEGKSVAELRDEVTAKFRKYVPDAEVTVAVKQATGNKVYVLGMVNRPGEFVLNRRVDVMQALSMASGIAKFADIKKITILRRSGESQQAIPFDYSQVEKGKSLEQNIVLKPGDVVVVP